LRRILLLGLVEPGDEKEYVLRGLPAPERAPKLTGARPDPDGTADGEHRPVNEEVQPHTADRDGGDGCPQGVVDDDP
jgi:hypothetical protein